MLQAPIIVGGCPRSGTTLLRRILDSHPNIACGPELKIISLLGWHYQQLKKTFGEALRTGYGFSDAELAESFGQQIEFLLARYATRQGRTRAAEKTPQNVHVFALLSQMLPRSPLIQVIRDGRDVVASLLRQDWVNMLTGERFGYTKDAAEAARYWVQCVRDGRAVPPEARSRYIELRYEDLVRAPEDTLRPLFERLGEPWVPDVLEFHLKSHVTLPSEVLSQGTELDQPINANAIGRWRTQLDETQKSVIKEIAGPLLGELGYAASAADW